MFTTNSQTMMSHQICPCNARKEFLKDFIETIICEWILIEKNMGISLIAVTLLYISEKSNSL